MEVASYEWQPAWPARDGRGQRSRPAVAPVAVGDGDQQGEDEARRSESVARVVVFETPPRPPNWAPRARGTRRWSGPDLSGLIAARRADSTGRPGPSTCALAQVEQSVPIIDGAVNGSTRPRLRVETASQRIGDRSVVPERRGWRDIARAVVRLAERAQGSDAPSDVRRRTPPSGCPTREPVEFRASSALSGGMEPVTR
jgi:hypothetical protein